MERDIKILLDLMRADLQIGSSILQLSKTRKEIKSQILDIRNRIGQEGINKLKEL